MSTGGYLDNRTTKPVGLIVIIGAHVAILSAIAFSHPEFVPIIKYVDTKLIDVPADKEPPPPDPIRAKVEPQGPATTETLVKTAIPMPEPVVITLKQPTIDEWVAPKPQPETIKPEPVFVTATIDPRAQAQFQPDYPMSLIREGIEGFATVRVLIGSDGRVRTIEMVNATDVAFFEATKKQALRFWRFKPATSDGTAVESWRTMTVRFKITN